MLMRNYAEEKAALAAGTASPYFQVYSLTRVFVKFTFCVLFLSDDYFLLTVSDVTSLTELDLQEPAKMILFIVALDI